jgi:hypothetical protein
MERFKVVIFLLSLLSLGCEIVIEDPNGLRARSANRGPGSRSSSGPVGNLVDLSALRAATAEASRATTEAREIAAQTRASLARVERLIASLKARTGDLEVAPKEDTKAAPVTGSFDHSDLDGMLKKYVKDGLVNYKDWKNNDLKRLDGYLDRVRATDPAVLADDKHRMVFWINVYNAWTVRSMMKFYPTTSIRNHEKGKSSDGFGIWKNNPITISGTDYHLEGIEHQILRPLGDPRIHFAIVCASIGCPPLRAEAFTVENLGSQMDDNGRVFFATKSKFKVDLETKTVSLSKIFDWFSKDFGADKAAVLAHLSKWVTDPAASKLMASGQARVAYLDYDWTINEQK